MTASAPYPGTLESRPSQPAAALPCFNPQRMEEIAEQAGSYAIVYELIELFDQDVRERLGELSRAVSEQDRVKRERVAHSIKGSCANLGAERMAKLAEHIEHCAETGASEQLPAILNEFEALSSALKTCYPR